MDEIQKTLMLLCFSLNMCAYLNFLLLLWHFFVLKNDVAELITLDEGYPTNLSKGPVT